MSQMEMTPLPISHTLKYRVELLDVTAAARIPTGFPSDPNTIWNYGV